MLSINPQRYGSIVQNKNNAHFAQNSSLFLYKCLIEVAFIATKFVVARYEFSTAWRVGKEKPAETTK